MYHCFWFYRNERLLTWSCLLLTSLLMTVYKLTNICPAHRQTNHQAFISQPISASHKQQIYSFLSFVFLLSSSLCKLAIILRSCIYFTAVITFSSADDDVGGSNYIWQVVARFLLFYKQNGAFLGSLKAKQLILVSKITLTDPYVTSRDLHGRKPYKFGVQVNSSRLCSMRALCSRATQRNRFTQTSLSKVCSMYWQKYKSQIVGLCSFNNF